MSPSANNNDGVFQDTIAELSEPISSLSSITPLVQILAMAYKIKTPPPAKQDRLASLMYTLATLKPSGKIYSHQEICNSFIRILSPVLNGMAGLQDFEDAVGASLDPENFRKFWTLEERNLIKEFIEYGEIIGSSPGADVPFLETFVEDGRCRVALGKDNHQLILVPGDAKVGDDIWLRTVLNDGHMAFRESSLTSEK